MALPSFSITVRDKTEFARAIKRKLLLEIAEVPGLPLIRIQAPGGAARSGATWI